MTEVIGGLKLSIEKQRGTYEEARKRAERIESLTAKATELQVACAKILYEQMKVGNVSSESVEVTIDPYQMLQNQASKNLRPQDRVIMINSGLPGKFFVETLSTPVELPKMNEDEDLTMSVQVFRFRPDNANRYHGSDRQWNHDQPIPSTLNATYIVDVTMADKQHESSDGMAVTYHYYKSRDQYRNTAWKIDDKPTSDLAYREGDAQSAMSRIDSFIQILSGLEQ